MRYHLKEDGTAGVCKAEVGKCPKGEAIHGESIQEVYSKLEKVMEDQLFKSEEPIYPPQPPRPTARELGAAGMLVHVRQPFVVKQQLEALRKLGIVEEAIPTLEAHNPILAGAVKSGNEDLIDFDRLYVAPQDYGYVGSDGGSYIGQTDTWTGITAYELQTVALNHLMDKLEKSELEGTDLKALGTALGHVEIPEEYPDKHRHGSPQREFTFDYMAFNYNPQRQDYDFYNNLKNRLVKEGFAKRKLSTNRQEYTVPGFLWKGLDKEAKERFAAKVLSLDYSPRSYPSKSYKDRVLGREFGNLMSTTFAPNQVLNGAQIAEGSQVKIPLDYNEGTATGFFKLTDEGFQWTELSRTYNS